MNKKFQKALSTLSFKRNSNIAIFKNDNVIFDKSFLIVGDEYNCKKNSKFKRSDIIKKTSLKTPIRIEKYTYKKLPAYMIVNSKYNLDIGVLSAGAAAYLSDYFFKGSTIVELEEKVDSSFRVHVKVIESSN